MNGSDGDLNESTSNSFNSTGRARVLYMPGADPDDTNDRVTNVLV